MGSGHGKRNIHTQLSSRKINADASPAKLYSSIDVYTNAVPAPNTGVNSIEEPRGSLTTGKNRKYSTITAGRARNAAQEASSSKTSWRPSQTKTQTATTVELQSRPPTLAFKNTQKAGKAKVQRRKATSIPSDYTGSAMDLQEHALAVIQNCKARTKVRQLERLEAPNTMLVVNSEVSSPSHLIVQDIRLGNKQLQHSKKVSQGRLMSEQRTQMKRSNMQKLRPRFDVLKTELKGSGRLRVSNNEEISGPREPSNEGHPSTGQLPQVTDPAIRNIDFNDRESAAHVQESPQPL